MLPLTNGTILYLKSEVHIDLGLHHFPDTRAGYGHVQPPGNVFQLLRKVFVASRHRDFFVKLLLN